HTTWFFETFFLAVHVPGYTPFHPAYGRLFNSYYHAVGERWARPARGLLSRPTVQEVYAYRRAVDDRVLEYLDGAGAPAIGAAAPVVELGLNHEQQHQELLLTDLKHAFSCNPLRPAYRGRVARPPAAAGAGGRAPRTWVAYPEGVREIGHDGASFAFDNEGPRDRA